jgi:predicted metal-dependent hydrolase
LYPNEYIQYLVHFHGDRDYFECHEILEAYWKDHEIGNKESVWVGLIQLAVSCYHHRRNNYIGAKKTLDKSIKILKREEQSLSSLGLNRDKLFSLLEQRSVLIEKNLPYTSFELPLTDPQLARQCQARCLEDGFRWCAHSNLRDNNLINRHQTRDRTNIIQEREKALKRRKGSE